MEKKPIPNLDWKSLVFGYTPSDYNLRVSYINGKWGEVETHDSEYLNLHMAATCLQYGQEVFEGQKAYRGKDGKIRLFRIEENAKRIYDSAVGLAMEPVPIDLFVDMAKRTVLLNERFIPPYETEGSLYLRPLEIGITPRVGVSAAYDYQFVIFASPVGNYFRDGFVTTEVAIYREYDRAAPQGTGRFKTGGNYAASLCALARAKAAGYSAVLFIDPREKKYLDECGLANFFAIKGDKYITPASNSILPSITNKSLQQIARDMGLTVECRPIEVGELADFDEAAECGTAAACIPISAVYDADNDKRYVLSPDGKPGPVVTELYNRMRAIQRGDAPDPYGWTTILDGVY